MHAITESGAPTGDKHVLLWNPPVVNPDLGLRASARSQSNRIARLAIRAGLKTLVFAQSRTMVEVLTKYLKDVFDHDPRKPARIRAYRGGYLPTERRDAEKRDARRAASTASSAPRRWNWASTSAASTWCVLNGYPGLDRRHLAAASVAPAGASSRRSACWWPAAEPLDQYMVRHPEFFSDAPPEHARIAPDQPLILLDHIRCAAFELPFMRGERFGAVDADAVPRSARPKAACCIARASAGTGSPTAIRPTRSACARSPTATSSWSTAPTAARRSSPKSTTPPPR